MPNLTAKELSSLEDQLSAEQLLVKKYKSYAVLSSDQNHYDRLLAFLN